MPEHQYYESKDISPDDNWGQLNIVDGGLALCKICGGLEGGLTTDCPGHKITMDKQDEVYKGEIDYRDGEGWVKKLNPTNVMWLYGAYIRWDASDIQFAAHNNISYNYFLEVKQYWIDKGLNFNRLEKK